MPDGCRTAADVLLEVERARFDLRAAEQETIRGERDAGINKRTRWRIAAAIGSDPDGRDTLHVLRCMVSLSNARNSRYNAGVASECAEGGDAVIDRHQPGYAPPPPSDRVELRGGTAWQLRMF